MCGELKAGTQQDNKMGLTKKKQPSTIAFYPSLCFPSLSSGRDIVHFGISRLEYEARVFYGKKDINGCLWPELYRWLIVWLSSNGVAQSLTSQWPGTAL